jgi:hypothetical protein
MWSLPKIKEMNARAAANRRQIEREAKLKTSRKRPCECCDRPSTRHRRPADKPFTGLFTKAGDIRVLPITFSKRYNLPRWAGIRLDSGWETGRLQIEGVALYRVSDRKESA